MHAYRWLLRRVTPLSVSVLVATLAGGTPASVFEHAKPAVAKPTTAAAPSYRVLVYTRTTGYRHASIAAGLSTLEMLGADNGFAVDTTADPTVFTSAKLSRYATVVFLSTTGNPVPTQPERAAFQHYIEDGGGFVGIHAASDAGSSWPWYGGLIGAKFKRHPAVQTALVQIEDHQNPATAGLRNTFVEDEWYDFQHDPRGTVHVLADVNDATYAGSDMGSDHPITWCQNYDGGRSFYTAMGHAQENYDDPTLQQMLLGGIQVTAGVRAADCTPN